MFDYEKKRNLLFLVKFVKFENISRLRSICPTVFIKISDSDTKKMSKQPINPPPPSRETLDEAVDEEGEEGLPSDTIGLYEGERNDAGERHGYGHALLPNGDQYDGEYRNGFRHGPGTYYFKKGHRYTGSWKQGLKHGMGKFYYPDGSIYEGEWKSDQRQGYGVYIYPNADRYEGNWYKGRKHGTGNYIYKEHDVNFHGTWKDGVVGGPVEIIFDRHRFHGHYQDNQAIGPAVYSFDHKYMTVGYMSAETGKQEQLLDQSDEITRYTGKAPTKWTAIETKLYDFQEIPQQPVSLPIMDSMESICKSISEEASVESIGGEEGEEHFEEM